MEERVISPLAIAGDLCYMVVRPLDSAPPAEDAAADAAAASGGLAAGDRLVAYSVGQLTLQGGAPLKGRVLMGPARIDDLVLLATDDEGLMCFDGQIQPRWTYKTPRALAGEPWLAGDELVVAMVDGAVVKLAVSDGSLIGQASVAEPLGGGPTMFGPRVLVSGQDGAVHVLESFQ